jgi:hypothetical protein
VHKIPLLPYIFYFFILFCISNKTYCMIEEQRPSLTFCQKTCETALKGTFGSILCSMGILSISTMQPCLIYSRGSCLIPGCYFCVDCSSDIYCPERFGRYSFNNFMNRNRNSEPSNPDFISHSLFNDHANWIDNQHQGILLVHYPSDGKKITLGVIDTSIHPQHPHHPIVESLPSMNYTSK